MNEITETTEWVRADLASIESGAQVKATRGMNVLVGTFHDAHFIDGMRVAGQSLWDWFVPAAPKVELPTEVGVVIRWQETHIGAIAERELPNQWLCNWDADTQTDAEIIERINGRPYFVLEPVPVTAKNIIKRIDTMRQFGEASTLGNVQQILAAEFGVPNE